MGKGEVLYKMHQPTCLGGVCVNCFTEGNPCGKGCCKMPFWLFDAKQEKTGGNAEHLGKILKMPKSIKTEIFTSANAFLVEFPENAGVTEKATLVGASVYLNSIFFEG